MKYVACILFFLLQTNWIISNTSNISFIDGDYWFPFPTISMDYSNNSIIDMSYLIGKLKRK